MKKQKDTFFVNQDFDKDNWQVIVLVNGRFHYFSEGKHFELRPVDFQKCSDTID